MRPWIGELSVAALVAFMAPSQAMSTTRGVTAPPRHSPAPVAAPSSSAPVSPARVASLRRQVDAAMSDAARWFTGDLYLYGPPPPFLKAKGEWRRRISRCRDDACRARLLEDQLNRLRFWQGKPNRGVPPLPWRTGQFSMGHIGSVQLLPIIDDLLLVHMLTVQVNAARICGKAGSGRWNRKGVTRIEAAGEFGGHFPIRRTRDGQLELMDYEGRPSCMGIELGVFRNDPPRR